MLELPSSAMVSILLGTLLVSPLVVAAGSDAVVGTAVLAAGNPFLTVLKVVAAIAVLALLLILMLPVLGGLTAMIKKLTRR